MAKNTAITYRGVHINIVDTPATPFRLGVERTLTLVDASGSCRRHRGPAAPDTFVLKRRSRRAAADRRPSTKSTGATPPPPRCSTRSTTSHRPRGDGRPARFPLLYTNARTGTATLKLRAPGVARAAVRDDPDHRPGAALRAEAGLQFRGRCRLGRLRRRLSWPHLQRPGSPGRARGRRAPRRPVSSRSHRPLRYEGSSGRDSLRRARATSSRSPASTDRIGETDADALRVA